MPEVWASPPTGGMGRAATPADLRAVNMGDGVVGFAVGKVDFEQSDRPVDVPVERYPDRELNAFVSAGESTAWLCQTVPPIRAYRVRPLPGCARPCCPSVHTV